MMSKHWSELTYDEQQDVKHVMELLLDDYADVFLEDDNEDHTRDSKVRFARGLVLLDEMTGSNQAPGPSDLLEYQLYNQREEKKAKEASNS
jgi:hypothetical protein